VYPTLLPLDNADTPIATTQSDPELSKYNQLGTTTTASGLLVCSYPCNQIGRVVEILVVPVAPVTDASTAGKFTNAVP
jgi:hypothetical protein